MVLPKPPVTVIDLGGVNQWVNASRPKLAVVCHIMEGTLQGCDSWFRDPAAQASANFGIGKNGEIHQYVDPDGPNCPFANGLVQKPDAQAQAIIALGGNVNLNDTTISIEHEGQSGDALTDAQFDASTRLAAWACDHFGIPAVDARFLAHGQIDSVTRAHCPGWSVDTWNRWEARVIQLVTGAPQPLPPTPKPVPPAPPMNPEWTLRTYFEEQLALQQVAIADTTKPGSAVLAALGTAIASWQKTLGSLVAGRKGEP